MDSVECRIYGGLGGCIVVIYLITWVSSFILALTFFFVEFCIKQSVFYQNNLNEGSDLDFLNIQI